MADLERLIDNNQDDANQNTQQIVTLTWDQLNVRVNVADHRRCSFFRRNVEAQTKVILNNVSGNAFPGQVLALMGSSGAGKTTLLNTLTGRSMDLLNWTGLIRVNGRSVEGSELTRMSAYVQQQDLFIPTLTVKEHLIYQALLRMDNDCSYTRRMIRVEEVIMEMGLCSCMDTRIGKPGKTKGISGGEMKRLAFASEVLTNPLLMFCDEPTSGLDSVMAFNVVTVLKNMAAAGRTIVCSIHQPSSETYALFNRVLFLSGGRTVFLGSPVEAKEFFQRHGINCPENFNPAEIFMRHLTLMNGGNEETRNKIEMMIQSFAEEGQVENINNGVNEQTDVPLIDIKIMPNNSYRYKTSWCKQAFVLLQRSFLTIRRERMLITVRFVQTLILSILLAAIYWQQILNQDGVMNINGAIFVTLTNVTFQNVMAVINVFCSEIPVFLREHWNGMYRTDAYFLSKTLAELPFFILLPVVFASIMYWSVGMKDDWRAFLIFVALVTLVCNIAVSFGYMISCVTSTIDKAMSVGPPLITPIMLFGGFFLNTKSIPWWLTWIKYLSWFHYGNESLQVNQWHDIENIECKQNRSVCFKDGTEVLHYYSFKVENFYFDVTMLCVLFVGFRLIALIGLFIKSRRKM